MSAYSAPTEDITEFNTSLFNQPEETLSQAEADKLYLSKTKSDISTAGSLVGNACYSFPDSGSELLGSYSRTGQTLQSTAYTTPNYQQLAFTTINTGVYRIDWMVTTTTTMAGVHSGYDYLVSETSASSTPVYFVGSQLKSIFGGTYGAGSTVIISSSFTYQSMTTSKTLYLNISSSYLAPWAGNWLGSIACTRIA